MAVHNYSQPRELHVEHKQETMVRSYQVRESCHPQDLEWDAFLAKTAGGHHVQTSLWGQVKAQLGWRATRVIVSWREHIVAGAQVLIRPLRPIGAIGYVPKGPLSTVDDPLLIGLIIKELQQIVKAQHILYMVIQPPNNGQTFADYLPFWGFRPSLVNVAPTATLMIDLTKSLDDILAQMKKNTRKNIRHGLRNGVVVREGTDGDLDTFYDLLLATARRQHFSPYPKEYFVEMWRIFHPQGYIRLFVAEFKGEAVSAHLVIPFGNTLISKLSGWSGRHGKYKPNEVLEWEVIKWAKTQGFYYYDFEGIEREAAKTILRGEYLPASLVQTPASFKFGFGGQVVFFPGAYDYVSSPFLRGAYNTVFQKVKNWSVIKQVVSTFRTRSAVLLLWINLCQVWTEIQVVGA